MNKPGEIFSEEAYALGKMLDHSAWQKGNRVLPRGITSSDIDLGFNPNGEARNVTGFDNNDRTILAEFSSRFDRWLQTSTGQRRFYQSQIRSGPHCAVMCRHNVTPAMGRKICTRFDVISFQPMFFDHTFVIGSVIESNEAWQDFVFDWFADPFRVRRQYLGKSAGLKEATTATLQQAIELVEASGFCVRKAAHPDWLTRAL